MDDAGSRFAQGSGYRFSDQRLLERALTHRSASQDNNERLEFLGDAILNLLIAEALFQHFPVAREGELTRLRAALVRRETLAEVARDLGLGAFLRLGAGERKTGGRDRDSILADAFEAVVGAVYLDGDIQACRGCVLAVFGERLESIATLAAEKDPKTRLQEVLQARKLPLPAYAVTQVEGAAHEHSFTVECRISGVSEATVGLGSNRRGAEQEAARKALELIGDG